MKIAFHSKPFVSFLFTLILGFSLVEDCFAAARREVKIPDIPPYRTLKCDFHTHTVFSDGQVWPTVRVEEAWREGLDAIAITDHIEYKPHKSDVRPDGERAYEIAKTAGDKIGLIIIRGAEITRDMPPGHFNAIFLKDTKALDTRDFNDVMKNALSQGAFIFWNHPGWEGQQEDGVPRWYPIHTEAYEKGWMQGIEIVNEDSYYPLAHKWATEKKLTIVGNSDIHNPMCLAYDCCKGEHRPMTLVFVKDRNEDGIKEALQAHRTAIYYKNSIIGDEKFIRAIFEKSVQMPEAEVQIKGKGKAYVRIRNNSEVDFELVADGQPEQIKAAGNITLYGDRTVMLAIEGKGGAIFGTKKISIPYKVKNLLIAPDENLRIEPVITVNFVVSDSK
ncbi:MAG: Sb-PDE family phosphodiesterase [Planctomycetota bacterium]